MSRNLNKKSRGHSQKIPTCLIYGMITNPLIYFHYKFMSFCFECRTDEQIWWTKIFMLSKSGQTNFLKCGIAMTLFENTKSMLVKEVFQMLSDFNICKICQLHMHLLLKKNGLAEMFYNFGGAFTPCSINRYIIYKNIRYKSGDPWFPSIFTDQPLFLCLVTCVNQYVNLC